MYTKNLIGAPLDWTVARILNHQWRCPWILEKEGFIAWQTYEQAWGNPTPEYSTDWAHGGPLIEREQIWLAAPHQARKDWYADAKDDTRCFGPTPLIAAMRCFVASKLGSEIDLPEVLTTYLTE